MLRRSLAAALVALVAAPHAASADEGMWTFNGFPAATVGKRHGFTPDAQWLEHVRSSSARIGGGCSASFVSEAGLVMTNHHCVHGCVEELSTAGKDLVKTGFHAKTPAEELRCPAMEVDQLLEITEVTPKITEATKGLTGKAFLDAQKAAIAKIEKDCVGGDGGKTRCDVVNLYAGGRYDLYRYRRYDDVRLSFVPEFAIAFFGGDPDNFEFPRYDLDVGFVRVYDGGKPAKPSDHFRFAKAPAKAGDLVFTSGTPGRTSRLLPIAKLEFERDVRLPHVLMVLSEYRGRLAEFARRGEEQRRISNTMLFYVENGVKAMKGRLRALSDKAFFGKKIADENALRQAVLADPKMRAAWYPAWGEIDRSVVRYRAIFEHYLYLEGGYGFRSDLFSHAKGLLRLAEERAKPNDKRLREYTDAKLPAVEQHLLSEAPIYPEFEIFTLAFSLEKLREALGADDPFVKKVLGKESPQALAKRVVEGSKLRELETRKALLAGGRKALEASKDPMIELVRRIDPDLRAVRRIYEDEVESVETKAGEAIAKARFAVYGTSIYPDATGTHRLSFGTIKGWTERGTAVAPMTTIGGAFDRHTGEDPFALPASWLSNKGRLALGTPMNFVSTNDIIGGNSGSPVISRDGEIVGLVFDGNLPSLGGDYGFDETSNRAVSVHASALVEALTKIYGATSLVAELTKP
jgi:hypothetical protein